MSVKLCVMGDGGVGKTATTIQMISNHFVEYYDPTIEDSYRREIMVEMEGQSRTLHLEILDTAGQDDFSPLRDSWIRDCEGFLLVYSVTNRKSLEYLEEILAQIERTKGDEDGFSRSRILVAGNKCDLLEKREVSHQEAEEWGRNHGVRMAQFSAKTREKLVETWTQLIVQVAIEKGYGTTGGKNSTNNNNRRRAQCNIL